MTWSRRLFDLSVVVLAISIGLNLLPPSIESRTIFGVERRIDIPKHVILNETVMKELEEPFGENCERGWFESCVKGVQLHYRRWLPPTNQKPSAIVVYVHGIQTHSGNAIRIRGLVSEGCAVYSHDFYGHGYSEGQRWLIPKTWRTNLDDLRTFLNLVAAQHDTDTPIFLMSESYGSNVALILAREFQDHPERGPKTFDSVIVTCPCLDPPLPPYPVLWAIRYFLAPLFPLWVPSSFYTNPGYNNNNNNKQYKQTLRQQLGLDTADDAYSLRTGAELVRTMQTARHVAVPGLSSAFCLIHGTQDRVCRLDGAEYLWKTGSHPDSEFHRLPGVGHNVFAKHTFERSTQIVSEWIHKRLARRRKQKQPV